MITDNSLKSNLKNKKFKFPPETAGRLMITNVPVAQAKATIGEVKKELYQNIHRLETINYIYIINHERKLVGVISVKDILRQPKDMIVTKAMTKKLIYAHPYTDQERVAFMALKNNIKSVPVVDKQKVFLGVVPSDVLLEVMYREVNEDLLRLAGISHRRALTDNVMELPIMVSIKHRLPWLLIGLAGGILAARIIGLFENTLQENLILAAFIPLIVYMGGAVEAQMVTFMIRDTALNPKLPFGKYFLHQFRVVLLVALILSIFLYTIGFAFYHDLKIASVVGVALFTAITSSVLVGLIVPYFFSRLKLDPANASGPIATIIQDLLSVTIYFTIASLIL